MCNPLKAVTTALLNGGAVLEFEPFRHYGPGPTDPGESSVLAEGVALDCHVLGARDFVDGLGGARGRDEGDIGSTEDEDGSTLLAYLMIFNGSGDGGGKGGWGVSDDVS